MSSNVRKYVYSVGRRPLRYNTEIPPSSRCRINNVMPRLASPRLRAGATQTAASSHSSLQDVATNKSKARKYYKNVKNLRQICDTNYNLCKKLSKSSKNIQVFQKIHHVPHTEIRKRFITATNKTNSVRR